MATSSLNVSDLTDSEKIALMERLWEALAETDELTAPPTWHEEVLTDREKEWEQRRTISQNWEEAKAEIRKDVR